MLSWADRCSWVRCGYSYRLANWLFDLFLAWREGVEIVVLAHVYNSWSSGYVASGIHCHRYLDIQQKDVESLRGKEIPIVQSNTCPVARSSAACGLEVGSHIPPDVRHGSSLGYSIGRRAVCDWTLQLLSPGTGYIREAVTKLMCDVCRYARTAQTGRP